MGRLERIGWLCTFGLLVSACGGGGGGGSSVSPPPPPPPPPPPAAIPTIDVAQVFPALTFNGLVSLQQAPRDATRWFAVEQPGVIRQFANDAGASASSVVLDITDRVVSGGERGLLGIAFHPNFPATPDLFVSYTGDDNGLNSFISRFSSTDGGSTFDPNSEQVVISVNQDASNHNGGHLAFGPDGYLYLGLGDGGGAGDPNERGQDNLRLLGTMIRLDIDGGSPYAIPAGNPFETNPVCPLGASGTQECPEIYAWGLRNPWRYSFDRQTGTLWLGDVGQNQWEEIDIITAGGNYGWNEREGAHCFVPSCSTDSIDPITEYGRDLGASVTGGFVYRGSAVPDLVGWYVYGDFVSGRIFAIPADSQQGTETIVLLESGLSISTFAEDQDGELYVIDYSGNSTIHRITDAP